MAQGFCAMCLGEGRQRTTGLVLDGEFVCASHAAKPNPSARFKPETEPPDDAWGMPASRPAPDPPPVKHLCLRGCGKPAGHVGRCLGHPLADPDPPPVLPPAIPAEEMRIESPTAPPLPTPPTSTPPAAETSPGQIRVIPLSAVPGVLTASGMRVSDILAAVLNAPKGHAVEVPCRDVSHAQCTVREVRRRASKNEIKVQSRTSREKVWIWRKQPALGAA